MCDGVYPLTAQVRVPKQIDALSALVFLEYVALRCQNMLAAPTRTSPSLSELVRAVRSNLGFLARSRGVSHARRGL